MAKRKLNKDELTAWLEDQPPQVSVAIATRSALRVLPLLNKALNRKKGERAQNIILPLFRGSAASWATVQFPDRSKEIRVSRAFIATAEAFNAASKVNSAVAGHAASAIYEAANSASTTFNTPDAGAAAAYLGVSATMSANMSSPTSRAELTDALEEDRSFITKDGNAADLARQPLWHNKRIPDVISLNWKELNSTFLHQMSNWEVWTAWYEARLKGSSGMEDLEIARLALPEEIWMQGPKVANAEIKRLEEEFRDGKPLTWGETAWGEGVWGGESEPSPEPGMRAEVVDGELELRRVNVPDEEVSDPLQQSLHQLALDRAKELFSALHQKRNYYPEIYKAVSGYLSAVDCPLSEVNVTTAWSDGSALMDFSEAYKRQDSNQTLSEPLEPGLQGLLSSFVNDHSGFF